MANLEIVRVVLGAYQENAYIARKRDRADALVIDPGDDYNTLRAAILRSGLNITHAVLTHGHFDHLLSAAHIKNEFGARVCISGPDAKALDDAKISLVPKDARTPFIPIRPDEILTAGAWEACGIEFEIIETPGHTPGGICLYSKGDALAFTGDTLFDDGFGRTDLPGGDWPALYRSLKKLLKLPGDIRVYSGHGESATIADILKVFGHDIS